MPLSDIYKDGLERDVALRRAAEAADVPSRFSIATVVDRFSGALRALRSGRDGSMQIAPGPDYGRDMGAPLQLFDQPLTPLALNDSDLFDTHRWDWMLLTVQSDLSTGDGIPAELQVYALATINAADLVFATPLFGTNVIETFVVPVLHDTHFVRVNVPAGGADNGLYVTAQRIPPGFQHGAHHPQTTILLNADEAGPNTFLTSFFDRTARGFILQAYVAAVANPTTRVASLQVRPFAGQSGVPLWEMPLGAIGPVHSVARVPQLGPVTVWFMTTGAAGPTWDIAVDLTPIYHG